MIKSEWMCIECERTFFHSQNVNLRPMSQSASAQSITPTSLESFAREELSEVHCRLFSLPSSSLSLANGGNEYCFDFRCLVRSDITSRSLFASYTSILADGGRARAFIAHEDELFLLVFIHNFRSFLATRASFHLTLLVNVSVDFFSCWRHLLASCWSVQRWKMLEHEHWGRRKVFAVIMSHTDWRLFSFQFGSVGCLEQSNDNHQVRKTSELHYTFERYWRCVTRRKKM